MLTTAPPRCIHTRDHQRVRISRCSFRPNPPDFGSSHITTLPTLEFFYIDGLVCLYRATVLRRLTRECKGRVWYKETQNWQHKSPSHNRVARSDQGKTRHLLPPFIYTSALLYPSPCPPHPPLRSNSLKSSAVLYTSLFARKAAATSERSTKHTTTKTNKREKNYAQIGLKSDYVTTFIHQRTLKTSVNQR